MHPNQPKSQVEAFVPSLQVHETSLRRCIDFLGLKFTSTIMVQLINVTCTWPFTDHSIGFCPCSNLQIPVRFSLTDLFNDSAVIMASVKAPVSHYRSCRPVSLLSVSQQINCSRTEIP